MKFSIALFLASATKISGETKYSGVRVEVDCKHSGTTHETTTDDIKVIFFDANGNREDSWTGRELHGTDNCDAWNKNWVRCLGLSLLSRFVAGQLTSECVLC